MLIFRLYIRTPRKICEKINNTNISIIIEINVLKFIENDAGMIYSSADGYLVRRYLMHLLSALRLYYYI